MLLSLENVFIGNGGIGGRGCFVVVQNFLGILGVELGAVSLKGGIGVLALIYPLGKHTFSFSALLNLLLSVGRNHGTYSMKITFALHFIFQIFEFITPCSKFKNAFSNLSPGKTMSFFLFFCNCQHFFGEILKVL